MVQDLDAQKWQWREFAELYLQGSNTNIPAALKHINRWMSDKTYLVGTRLCSIDGDIHALLHHAIGSLSHQERGALPHLCRWFRLVQSSAPQQPGSVPVIICRTGLYA